ncbi:MAG: saccharopine dehydrogenase NADP-binding domain-containing protein [Bacteroidia bacterium]|nr:saccharopine dehydrogenase NADP-binding domain-containing protein [Bacteroidia bacterium]MDW8015957.1 saccharopine dehydrogenase NADP-binding domain-containing protein [Bacteroidia bacterium]
MWMIYGANGTTGRLVLSTWKRHFADLPPPIIAGRQESALRELSESYRLSYRVLPLLKVADLSLPSEVQLIVNLAGPYAYTTRPWIEACQRLGLAYMDVCGEWNVFEWLYNLKGVSIPIITSAGYDTTIGEAALYFLRQRHPEAKRLKLGIHAKGGFSAGTVKSALTVLREGYYFWRYGRLIPIPPRKEIWEVEPEKSYYFFCATLGELITFPAWNPDIEELSTWVRLPISFFRWRFLLERLASWGLFRGLLERLLDAWRQSLARHMDLTARSYAFARSDTYQVRLTSPQPYVVTAWTVLGAVRLFLAENTQPGVASAFARWREKLWQVLPDTEVVVSRL